MDTERPNIKNTLLDSANKVIYHVIAYRALGKQEIKMAVSQYISSKGKPKKNSVITIETIIGHDE